MVMRKGSFSLPATVFWAGTWAVGVAIGVALGAWITVVSGEGAPGVQSLDIAEDLLMLPALAGVAVFLLYLAGSGLVALVRARTAPKSSDDH